MKSCWGRKYKNGSGYLSSTKCYTCMKKEYKVGFWFCFFNCTASATFLFQRIIKKMCFSFFPFSAITLKYHLCTRSPTVILSFIFYAWTRPTAVGAVEYFQRLSKLHIKVCIVRKNRGWMTDLQIPPESVCPLQRASRKHTLSDICLRSFITMFMGVFSATILH